MNRPNHSHRFSNIALWIAFAATSVCTGAYLLLQIFHTINFDSALALAGLVCRTVLFTSIGLLVEALLLHSGEGFLIRTRARRALVHANWILVMLFCIALIVDVFVFAFAGFHLTTAVRILFSDGPEGVGQVVEATGVSPKLIIGSIISLVGGIGIAVLLSKSSRRFSSRAGIIISRKKAFRGVFFSIAILAIIEAVSFRQRDPFLWEREIGSLPLAFSFTRPASELASLKIKVGKPSISQREFDSIAIKAAKDLPDIFIVVIESLRRDIVTPEIMPRFSAFARENITFTRAQTTGNVTHYSWYGLFCAQFPLFFDIVKSSPEQHGSTPLALLRQMGYKIHLYATPNTEYQKLESIIFGPGGKLLADKFHPSNPAPAERDKIVIDELSKRLNLEPPGGNVYIVALDSSHFGYEWGSDFKPQFLPYAKNTSIAINYETDASARRELFNRYKNSASWIDSLIGKFLDSLYAYGRAESSIIVLTGDHGEAFWEHGSGTHGSDLGKEQLEVGFAMHLPKHSGAQFDATFSLIDVMPTLFKHLDIDSTNLFPGTPAQNLESNVSAPRKALTFQGWNSRAFRFVLTYENRRALLELDDPSPLKARHLALKDLTDLAGKSATDVGDRSVLGAYQNLVNDFPKIVQALPFLEADLPSR